MPERYLLAVDAGTTGITVLVLDTGQEVKARAYREVPCTFPKPGWVEQDAAVIRDTAIATMRQAMKSVRAAPRDIAGIGIANQRETTVLWGRRTGEPVAPAIVWQDRRTATRCEGLRADWQETVQRRTGLVLDPYFSATKLEWLLRTARLERRAATGGLAFGTIDTWLCWSLTGVQATDPTNASRTLLWDIHRSAWDAELLELFGIPASVLPEVKPSSHVIATTKESAFGAEIPVAALVGDQQAALFGARCFSAGQAKNTYGTGCFLLQHTGSEAVASTHGLLTTRAASIDSTPRFALEGSVFTAGAAIQWLRDQLGIVASAPEVDELAMQTPDSGGVIMVPAFAGLGAPHWDADARGAILGLTRGADKRHVARATLESIAFQTADVVQAIESDSGQTMPELRVDGGASKSAPLLQFQADILQRPVVRPGNIETTAMGAGLLAGLAVGSWKMADLRSPPEKETRFKPAMSKADAAGKLEKWRAAVTAVQSFKP